jgi:hypothetical protein
MLLSELYDRLVSHFPNYAQKDLKTSIRYLAEALQAPDPQHCDLDHHNHSLTSLYRLVDIYLIDKGKTVHTSRNTKNNLSRLFRLAKEQHLFTLTPKSLMPHYNYRIRPHRPGFSSSTNHAYCLPYAHWPIDLQQAFADFASWATSPLIAGRPASLRKRPITVQSYRGRFARYFGFLHHIQGLSPLKFDDLFDIMLVTKYVHWHINDYHKRPTLTIRRFLTNLLVLTRHYRPMPELENQLLALRKTIPIPSPVYNKEDAWVSLATLDQIGRALWPHKQPKDLAQYVKYPGLMTAVYAGRSLMLRLWRYIPYRLRNMCEMQLGENLHKDSHGKWRITFRGEQLKIATKRGKLNNFDLPFPETLVPFLDNYLAIWRPILLAKASQPYAHVFLTMHGTPYTTGGLSTATRAVVYRYTGKYWHPHIVRSVWATEWIRNGGDFYKAAYMLNDNIETVVTDYAHLREENVAEEVFSLLDKRNGQGK